MMSCKIEFILTLLPSLSCSHTQCLFKLCHKIIPPSPHVREIISELFLPSQIQQTHLTPSVAFAIVYLCGRMKVPAVMEFSKDGSAILLCQICLWHTILNNAFSSTNLISLWILCPFHVYINTGQIINNMFLSIFFNLVASDGLYFIIHFYEVVRSNAFQHTACRLDSFCDGLPWWCEPLDISEIFW